VIDARDRSRCWALDDGDGVQQAQQNLITSMIAASTTASTRSSGTVAGRWDGSRKPQIAAL
jgi:hypothetical protein